MDGPAISADGDPASEPSPRTAALAGQQQLLPEVVVIAKAGDLILDVTFENSKATIKAARQASAKTASAIGRSQSSSSTAGSSGPPPPPKSQLRLGFRVDAGVLRRQSQYFDRLLSDTRFQEAKTIAAALEALTLRDVKPADADVGDLPWIQVVDDDEATHYPHRDKVFADFLSVLHGKETATAAAANAAAAVAAAAASAAATTAANATATTKAKTTPAVVAATPGVTLDFVAALAVLADRFDCAAPVSKSLNLAGGLKYKWPLTQRKQPPSGNNGEEITKMSRKTESVLRQKILVSYLLDQPPRFLAATRELIMNGSCKWTAFPDPTEAVDEESWWYLQDELEQELQYRRECILNTLASIPRHFLALYSSRTRQCKLGYDSSAACDSYQLGEMFKFFVNKNLLFLVDFSPASLDRIVDTSLMPVESILAALKQVPSYQIDSHHKNCGLRTRILPVLEFVQALLSANSVPVACGAWKASKRQTTTSNKKQQQQQSTKTAWFPSSSQVEETKKKEELVLGDDLPQGTFRFTRAVASDPRLRFEHALGADQFARDVFTAPAWDWTADQDAPPITSGFGRTPNLKMMYR
ncbi:hypothetical protein PGQ11_008438 [Apiospora arundinis]|uniref:Hydroxyproline-rich glyco protein n=1 Tax=Apiospora arundinis TaxID=335852 RepID=A0ABR2IF49_9PEZI